MIKIDSKMKTLGANIKGSKVNDDNIFLKKNLQTYISI